MVSHRRKSASLLGFNFDFSKFQRNDFIIMLLSRYQAQVDLELGRLVAICTDNYNIVYYYSCQCKW